MFLPSYAPTNVDTSAHKTPPMKRLVLNVLRDEKSASMCTKQKQNFYFVSDLNIAVNIDSTARFRQKQFFRVDYPL